MYKYSITYLNTQSLVSWKDRTLQWSSGHASFVIIIMTVNKTHTKYGIFVTSAR